MHSRVYILIPIYNDWRCLEKLLNELEFVLNEKKVYPRFIIVNDSSTEVQPHLGIHDKIVIHLRRNIGHQKAIAIGLSYIHNNEDFERVLIMDGDGEDNPYDALKLIQASINEEKIILAHRKSRTEKLWFQLFYKVYKIIFRISTGQKIAYGNFVVLPKTSVDKLVYYSEIWNHLTSTILKSKLYYKTVCTKKSYRYNGSSKMNFSMLLLHGLGAIGVFIDVIISRLLIASVALIILSLFSAATILSIRYFTNLAIPGWTSTLLSSTLIILLQGFMLSLFTLFLHFSSQSQQKFIPALHYNDYIGSIDKSHDSEFISR